MTGCLVWITFSINGQLDPDVTTGVSNLYSGRHQKMHNRVSIESSALHARKPRAPICCKTLLLSCHCQSSFPLLLVAST